MSSSPNPGCLQPLYACHQTRRSVVARIAIYLCILLIAVPISTAVAATEVPPGYASDLIDVRFREGTDVEPPEEALPPDLRDAVASIRRGFSLSEEQLNELRARGESLSGETLPNLNMCFRITLEPGTDPTAFIEDLRALETIETAQFVPLPPPPPQAITPNFENRQGYLDPAPGGIEARFSWTIPGGNGQEVTIYDIEYNWLQTHEDLNRANGIPLLLAPDDSNAPPGYPQLGCPAPCDRINREHGTAVLGELIADNNARGVTGISWGANIGLAPVNTVNRGYDPANAILLAVMNGSPGDVILIEQQAVVCNLTESDLGPLEWIDSVFDAIQTAVANRFVVVEAAGNGGVNLDQPACNNRFDRTMRDSGAIIVGAGGAPGSGDDRERLPFSSFGSRVDLQGWGQNVATTGYGTADPNGYRNPDAPDDPNFWYTFTFGGTSSASPIVAGAAANLQGIALARFGTPLLPFQIRQFLVATGSPQLGTNPEAEHIGPRPDLRAAIERITRGPIDLFILVDLSGSFDDDLPRFQAQAPGIVNTLRAANPDIRFGLGRFEDYPIPRFGSAAAGDTAYERLVDREHSVILTSHR